MKKKFGLNLMLFCGTITIAVAQNKITQDNIQFVDLNGDGKLQPYEDTRLPINQRIADVMSRMTVEEKANMLIGTGMQGFAQMDQLNPVVGVTEYMVPGCAGTTTPIDRLGIPAIVCTDGPAGVRISPTRKDNDKKYYATGFPVGVVLASTWDVQLVENVGRAIGNEALEYGSHVQLSPALNIMRNPLCGRNFEYFSEDPLISGKIASAYTKGVEKEGVATSVKHFAANNNETNRNTINVHVSQRALREIYLRGFEIVTKEANPGTFMSSYNKINGVYASADYDLLTTILRDEWGFKGIVMTDWGGGVTKETIQNPELSNTAAQIHAGNDLLMPGLKPQLRDILTDLKSGKLKIEDIDLSVKRILTLVFSSTKMQGFKHSDAPDLKAHAQVARQSATEGMVLLQNNRNTLPLGAKPSIALFGCTSYNLYAGGTGSGEVHKAYTTTLLQGMSNAGYTISKDLEDVYTPYAAQVKADVEAQLEKNKGLPIILPSELALEKKQIEKEAKTQDVAIITLGRVAGEFQDRKDVKGDFRLSDTELELLDNVSAAFHAQGKKVVVILNIGGVIETASWRDKADAILLAWQPGQEAGDAIVDVLSGKVNPSAKLTMTFPINYTDFPSSVDFPGIPSENPTDIYYKDGIYVGYRYFDSFNVKPAYEFGYGLSYTNFSVSNLRISDTQFSNEIFVSVDVKNTGSVAGKEVVQLYLGAPKGEVDKPVKELKAFAKTKFLNPGETQTLTMRLTDKDLASFNTEHLSWIADKGTYSVQVGTSIADIKQKCTFTLNETTIVEKVNNVLNPTVQMNEMKR